MIDLAPYSRLEALDASFSLILSRPPAMDDPDCFVWYDGPQLFVSRKTFDVPYLIVAVEDVNLATEGRDYRSVFLVAQILDEHIEQLRAGELDFRDAFGIWGAYVWVVAQYPNRDGAPAEAYAVSSAEIPEEWLPGRGLNTANAN